MSVLARGDRGSLPQEERDAWNHVAELVGGPMDGSHVIVARSAERPVIHGATYERTGEWMLDSNGGIYTHYFKHTADDL